MFDDDHGYKRRRLQRQLFLRTRGPGPGRTHLIRRLQHLSNDSDLFFQMVHDKFNLPNPTVPRTPIVRGLPKRSFEYTSEQMYSNFRFNHEQFQQLLVGFRVPDRLKFGRFSFSGEESLLLLLRRMSSVIRFSDLREEFRRDESELCAAFNGMVKWIVQHHGWLISGNLDRWRSQLRGWSRSIVHRSGAYDHRYYGLICMFIDGTCIRICRPSSGHTVFYDLQRLFYSGYKKYHNINFSVIVAPNGLCIDCCGPVPGRHSDKWTQSWSDTENRLRQLFQGTPFTVYGDAICKSCQ